MVNNLSKADEVALPSEADIILAEQSSHILATCLNSHQYPTLIIKEESKQEQTEIPFQALRLLLELLRQMAKGNAVTIVPIYHELSTQQGADLLNISRPYFINLLEKGKIPFRKVGTKRRVLAQDVLAYKMKEDEARYHVLTDLSTAEKN